MDDIDNSLNDSLQLESNENSGFWSTIIKIIIYIVTLGIAYLIGRGKKKKIYSEGYKNGSEDTSKTSKKKYDQLYSDHNKNKNDFVEKIEEHYNYENELIKEIIEHKTENTELKTENAELKDENTKLRDTIKELKDISKETSNNNIDKFLSIENGKIPFTKGINFSNWLEVRNIDQVIADFYTKEDFENIKKLGCDVVRIPINFEDLCCESEDYRIPELIFNIIDQIVLYLNELKIYAIIDFQNRIDIEIVNPATVEKLLNKVWIQMVQRYKEESEYLVFELMSEPFNIEFTTWNDIIINLHDKLRSIDSDRYLIISGTDHNSILGIKSLPDFEDNKVIFTFRVYELANFEYQGISWCHLENAPSASVKYLKKEMVDKYENNEDIEKIELDENDNNDLINCYVSFFDEYINLRNELHIPIYCSEFGCCSFCIEHERRVDWYSMVVNLLQERDIPWTCWDYFGPFGIYRIDTNRRVYRIEKPVFPDELDIDMLDALGLCYEVYKENEEKAEL